MGVDFSDVTSSVALLSCLDKCSDNAKKWVDRNLQLVAPTPKVLEVEKLIGDAPIGKIGFLGNAMRSSGHTKVKNRLLKRVINHQISNDI